MKQIMVSIEAHDRSRTAEAAMKATGG